MKNKSLKHWFVLATCCGLAASSIGISINSSGVFYSPVCESLNILRGNFSMHMTIFSLATALGALFVPYVMKKVPYKILLSISVLIAVFSTVAMGLSTHLIQFYFLGAIRGLSTSMFSIVPLTMIINQWFEAKHGFATSLVFGFSGLAGSICSPIFSYFIETFGWQSGYFIKAIFILCLCLPAVLYPFHMDPKEDELLPYGYQEKNKEILVDSKKQHFIFIAFFSFIIFSLMCSCITSLTQHFPGYAVSIGYSTSIGAMLLSAGMVGNIVSKLIIGVLSDRFGAFRATLFMLVINVFGVFLLMLAPVSVILILGAFLFGSSYSIGAVALPLLTRYFFGDEQYVKRFPMISFASNVGAAISLSMVGYIYDIFGSYTYAFFFALFMLLICFIMLIYTNQKIFHKRDK